MGKYPVLQGLSGLARVVGWLAICIAGILVIYGLVKLSEYKNDPIGAFTGILNIGSGLGIAMVALIVILVGETIKVFVDIEGNTSEAVRILRDAQKAEVALANDRIVTGAKPSVVVASARRSDGSLPVAREQMSADDIIAEAQAAGYTVTTRSDGKITLRKEGMESYCYGLEDLRRFHRLNKL